MMKTNQSLFGKLSWNKKKNLKTQTRINQICCCNIVKTFQTTSVQKEIEMQPDRQMGDTQADKKKY